MPASIDRQTQWLRSDRIGAMNGYGKYLVGYGSARRIWRVSAVAWAAVFLLGDSGLVWAQSAVGIGGEEGGPSSLHGTVLNQLTHEPISRALVFSPGNQYATLTDDRGHFEFKFPPQQPAPTLDETMTPEAKQRALRLSWAQNSRPDTLMARKPGFLEINGNFVNRGPLSSTADIKLYLVPESLIVGRINIPGSEGEVRIPVLLYRRDTSEGQARWIGSGSFMSWSDGEFRFAGLRAGTYKLFTGEQMDRDSFTPGEQMYGYPPVFFPNANDFETASPIQLAEGATFQANVSVARREYYSVKIPVANPTATPGMDIQITASGHPGPGYTLGYNPSEQAIEGMLPAGNYTLETESIGGETGSSGMMTFSVRGAAFEGAALNLVANASVNVTVREEFKNIESNIAGSGLQAVGPSPTGHFRQSNVQVMLNPLEDFPFRGGGQSQPVNGGDEDTLVIPNIGPGRYRVNVLGNPGYAASVVSGGADLLHGDLVVGLGAAVPTIEITLRDDGAEVTGTVDEPPKSGGQQQQGGGEIPMSFVYFVPVAGSTGQFRESSVGWDNTFRQEQLPPGTYRVLAFDRQQQNLAYADAEAMRAYESLGEVIQVSPGQKENLRLKVISGADSQ